MGTPRGLTAGERAAWERLARTVAPLDKAPPRDGEVAPRSGDGGGSPLAQRPAESPLHRPSAGPPPRPGEDVTRHGLDSSWDRKLRAATIDPDFTLDLHGLSLDAAHARLVYGITEAKAMGARLVLLVTGKPRPVEAADRGTKRGAIRAKVLDWLAAGPHGADIAAVRNAHRRHGGEGALYIVLKRKR